MNFSNPTNRGFWIESFFFFIPLIILYSITFHTSCRGFNFFLYCNENSDILYVIKCNKNCGWFLIQSTDSEVKMCESMFKKCFKKYVFAGSHIHLSFDPHQWVLVDSPTCLTLLSWVRLRAQTREAPMKTAVTDTSVQTWIRITVIYMKTESSILDSMNTLCTVLHAVNIKVKMCLKKQNSLGQSAIDGFSISSCLSQ